MLPAEARLTIGRRFEKERSETRAPGSCLQVRTKVPGYMAHTPRIRNRASAMTFSLRKEVIQPQVLLRLPCYDFTPIMSHTLGGCLPCG